VIVGHLETCDPLRDRSEILCLSRMALISALKLSATKLTHATVDGNIKPEWGNSAVAGTSLFGGKGITRRGMCMSIEMKGWL
jgi:hypothetical protein